MLQRPSEARGFRLGSSLEPGSIDHPHPPGISQLQRMSGDFPRLSSRQREETAPATTDSLDSLVVCSVSASQLDPRMLQRLLFAAFVVSSISPGPAAAQRTEITQAMRPFVSVDSPVVALINARVIDGTGAPARAGQTVILRDGAISAVGPTDAIAVPADAKVVDLPGKSVLPGLVQLREHLWLAHERVILNTSLSYPRLYLAAGVTSLRTAGAHNPYADLKVRADIDAGAAVGPRMDLTIYMDVFGAPRLITAEQTSRYVEFWLDSGFTSVKAYAYTHPSALKTAHRYRASPRCQDGGPRLPRQLTGSRGPGHRQPGTRLRHDA